MSIFSAKFDIKDAFRRFYQMIKPREPVNSLSHFLGFILSIVGIFWLIKNLPAHYNPIYLLSVLVFGISLVLLYCASTCYHCLNVPDKIIAILRKIDHMMIYVLIAGTYTPICIIALQGTWRWSLLLSIWILALSGIVLKLFWFNVPRWFSTSLYILMGWLVVIAIVPIIRSVPLTGFVLLLVGGLFYTLGAIIYGIKLTIFKSNFFGFHEIFHCFVLAGSISHYWMVQSLLHV